MAKIETAGTGFCLYCQKEVKYGTTGKSALIKHAQKSSHKEAMARATDQTQPTLPSAFRMSNSDSVSTRPVPVADRTSNLECMALAFVAERNLPTSISGGLIDFAQACNQDGKALNG